VRRVQGEWGMPALIAGGLTDANVSDLVTSQGPFGVDVASGIEDSPGVKNVTKTSDFVRNAKRALPCTNGADASPEAKSLRVA